VKHRKPRPPSRLRKAVAALSITAAAAGGTALLADTAAGPPDTTWGAPDTSDTTWTADDDQPGAGGDNAATDTSGTVTPMDTTWG
jgi:hypothetical protein